MTDGFTRDVSNPLPDGSFELDISSDVLGPVAGAAAVPEPATGLLIGSGLLWAFGKRRRSKTKARW